MTAMQKSLPEEDASGGYCTHGAESTKIEKQPLKPLHLICTGSLPQRNVVFTKEIARMIYHRKHDQNVDGCVYLQLESKP